jgi:hypothetical protein
VGKGVLNEIRTDESRAACDQESSHAKLKGKSEQLKGKAGSFGFLLFRFHLYF